MKKKAQPAPVRAQDAMIRFDRLLAKMAANTEPKPRPPKRQTKVRRRTPAPR